MSVSDVAKSFEDVTYRVMGAAMKVHNALGPGLKEAHYQRALSAAMTEIGLGYEEERPAEVEFEDKAVGLHFIDHLVEDSVVVEEKAFPHMLTDEDVAQVITYLRATDSPVGLLTNFGRPRLQYRRILAPRRLTEWRQQARRFAWFPKNDGSHPFIRSKSAVQSSAPAAHPRRKAR